MNQMQVNPNLDSLSLTCFGKVELLKKILLNLSRCRIQE